MGQRRSRLAWMRDGLQAEGVLSRWNHGQRNGTPIRILVQSGFEPGAKSGVEDLRVSLPEFWIQSALDLQMIQLQLDNRNVLRKITARVTGSNIQAGDAASLALRFDDHTYLLHNAG